MTHRDAVEIKYAMHGNVLTYLEEGHNNKLFILYMAKQANLVSRQ